MTQLRSLFRAGVGLTLIVAAIVTVLPAQEEPVRFGGSYTTLDARRQRYVDDWIARFSGATGQQIEPAAFYDDILRLSTKTTFEAVTHALMTTTLTDASGNALGDALALVENVDTVRGKVLGAAGDRQFRMYVRLTDGAMDTLARSQQFRRRGDNTIYHKGYPINFRGEGGTPSIQISAALDRRHADVDVDYRSSGFPAALVNGHLTASNSDVRAGSNFDRHQGRWTGFDNWWLNFFGISLRDQGADDDVQPDETPASAAPRVGKKPADVMTEDFLKAWLVEGDIRAALSYVSPRALACLAEDRDDPASFDRGMAPFILAHRLKAAHDAVGHHDSLENLVVGIRLTMPGLKTVTQPRHAQFVVYEVPDDIAVAFECGSGGAPARTESARRRYGNFFGATFYVKGSRSRTPVALLWGREGGYWRIVSWQTEPESDAEIPAPVVASPVAAPAHLAADPALASAAQRFLNSWLVRKDYDTAFSYISPAAYACYELGRSSEQPAASSLADAGLKIRAGLAQAGSDVGNVKSLADTITAVQPSHPATRVLDHRDSSVFTLTSVPDALVEAADCALRARGGVFSADGPPVYGKGGFGTLVRIRTKGGEAPVLRLLWMKENGNWRITAYDIEVP